MRYATSRAVSTKATETRLTSRAYLGSEGLEEVGHQRIEDSIMGLRCSPALEAAERDHLLQPRMR